MHASSFDRLQREDWGAVVLRRRTITQSLAARTALWNHAWTFAAVTPRSLGRRAYSAIAARNG
eukprot:3489193-Pyramimonas_sp.AAC.1